MSIAVSMAREVCVDGGCSPKTRGDGCYIALSVAVTPLTRRPQSFKVEW